MRTKLKLPRVCVHWRAAQSLCIGGNWERRCVCVDYPRALDWGSLCELKLEEEAGVSCEGDRKGEGAFIAS